MNTKAAAALLSGLLVACAQTQPQRAVAPPASAPPPAAAAGPASPPPAPPVQAAKPLRSDHVVNIQRASCQGLLALSPADRDAASMFYIGYQASRLRARTINVGLIPSIEDQALTYCVENPARTIAEVFAEAYRRTH
jgi:HdeA/HdeB family